LAGNLLSLRALRGARGVLAARRAAGNRTPPTLAKVTPMHTDLLRCRLLVLLAALVCAGAEAQVANRATLGEAVERHLPVERTFTQWTQDHAALEAQAGDRVETREVPGEAYETIKLA